MKHIISSALSLVCAVFSSLPLDRFSQFVTILNIRNIKKAIFLRGYTLYIHRGTNVKRERENETYC